MLDVKKPALAALAAASLAGCGNTGDTTRAGAVSADALVLQALESQGLTIHSPMAVPGGLDAFAASVGTQALAISVMPDADYAVIGERLLPPQATMALWAVLLLTAAVFIGVADRIESDAGAGPHQRRRKTAAAFRSGA